MIETGVIDEWKTGFGNTARRAADNRVEKATDEDENGFGDTRQKELSPEKAQKSDLRRDVLPKLSG